MIRGIYFSKVSLSALFVTVCLVFRAPYAVSGPINDHHASVGGPDDHIHALPLPDNEHNLAGDPISAVHLPDIEYSLPGELRSSILQFVITKGCSYLAGYIHMKYSSHHSGIHARETLHAHHVHDKCNWKQWVDKKCHEYHVPDEGQDAIIDCGLSYSMFALNASPGTLDTCNATLPQMSLENPMAVLSLHIFGKRHNSLSANIRTSSPLTSAIHSLSNVINQTLYSNLTANLPLHSSDMHLHTDPQMHWPVDNQGQLADPHRTDTHDPHRTDSHDPHRTDSHRPPGPDPHGHHGSEPHSPDPHGPDHVQEPHGPHLSPENVHQVPEPLSPQLSRWCHKFSRNIKKKYHFSEYAYVRKSKYWIFDVYHVADKFHLPKSYAHGLVGCGMNYALTAMNASQMQSFLYMLSGMH